MILSERTPEMMENPEDYEMEECLSVIINSLVADGMDVPEAVKYVHDVVKKYCETGELPDFLK